MYKLKCIFLCKNAEIRMAGTSVYALHLEIFGQKDQLIFIIQFLKQTKSLTISQTQAMTRSLGTE